MIAAFWENPENVFGQNLAKLSYILAKFEKRLKNQKTIQQFSTKTLGLEIDSKTVQGPGSFSPIFDYGFQKRCKGVHGVDLGESFLTSI